MLTLAVSPIGTKFTLVISESVKKKILNQFTVNFIIAIK